MKRWWLALPLLVGVSCAQRAPLEPDLLTARNYYRLALERYHAQRTAEAAEFLGRAELVAPGYPPVARLQAQLALDANHPRVAVGHAQRAFNNDPENDRNLVTLALAYWAAGEQARARQHLRWLVEGDQNNGREGDPHLAKPITVRALYYLAVLDGREGQYERCLTRLNRVIACREEYALRAQRNLGSIAGLAAQPFFAELIDPARYDQDTRREIEAARAQALAEGKKVLLFFHADNCPHCQQRARHLGQDAESALISATFVPVSINVGHESRNMYLALHYLGEDYSFPKLVVLEPDGSGWRAVEDDL